MSKSGDAPPPDVSTSLPSPSPSSSDLPADLPSFPRTTRDFLGNIHSILAATKAKKGSKTLTLNDFEKLFSSLDSIERSLDVDNVIQATLRTFQAVILEKIDSTLATRPSSSYASAASSSPLAALPPAASSSPKLQRQKHARSRSRVEAAIAATGIEKLKGVTVRGVKVLPRSRLLVAVDTDKDTSLLKRSSAHWVPRLTKNSALELPRCQIGINSVNRNFNPLAPGAAQTLCATNPSSFVDPSCISEMCWLNPKALRDPNKKASSLIVTITDILSADLCIARGPAVDSQICY
ncbi:hypothetical protein C8R43DRAFT_942732 [Mycena crocata]|nr:hypothetical protein C8R43DRAFT_942732 [Mycena crocata]